MKRFCLVCAVVFMVSLFPAMALASSTGVLTEGELVAWVDQVLRDSASLTPMNHPVGEESLTEDGYAFLYDFATLYYDKPVLDSTSVLQAIVMTDEAYAAPRGLRLGGGQDALLEAFGWQNPYLLGDGAFAVFYRVSDLPRAAYWSWAQLDENQHIAAVQCTVHVQAGNDAYTDVNLRVEQENGVISAIRLDGRARFITGADVQANLQAVQSVQLAMSGDAWDENETVAASSAPVFSQDDLAFAGMDFRTATIPSVQTALGEQPLRTETLHSGGEQIVTAEWTDVFLSGANDVEVLSVSSGRLSGPRGVCVGDSLTDVLAAFASDGEGRSSGYQLILYGDGHNAPCGVMERDGSMVSLAYTALMQRGGEQRSVTLMLQFESDTMTEWMLYTW